MILHCLLLFLISDFCKTLFIIAEKNIFFKQNVCHTIQTRVHFSVCSSVFNKDFDFFLFCHQAKSKEPATTQLVKGSTFEFMSHLTALWLITSWGWCCMCVCTGICWITTKINQTKALMGSLWAVNACCAVFNLMFSSCLSSCE